MFSRILYSTFIAMPFLAYLVASAPKCSESDLIWCMEELNAISNYEDLGFDLTEQELSRLCVHLQGAMQCVKNFTGRCFDTAQLDLYRTLTSGPMQLLEDLCTKDSEFRKQYLAHTSCYQNMVAEYRMCAANYLHQQQLARMSDDHIKDRLRKSCCLFDGYKECTRQAVEQKCGKEAADLAVLVVDKANGPLVQTHCANFKHNSNDCLYPYLLSSGRSSIMHSASHVINILISLILSAASHFYIRYR